MPILDTQRVTDDLVAGGLSQIAARTVAAKLEEAAQAARGDLATGKDVELLRKDFEGSSSALRKDFEGSSSALRKDFEGSSSALRKDFELLRNDLQHAVSTLEALIERKQAETARLIAEITRDQLFKLFGLMVAIATAAITVARFVIR